MTTLEVLRIFNDRDKYGIALRRLSEYCGYSEGTLSRYLTGKIEVGDKQNRQIREGLQQIVDEMQREINGICD